MALQDPSTYTPSDLANPALDEATLRHIAQYRPDLRGYVLQHPACSPALAQMIHASGAPQQPHPAQQPPHVPQARQVPQVPQAPAGFNLGQAAATASAQAPSGYPVPGKQQPPQAAYGQPQQQFAQARPQFGAQQSGQPQQFG